MAKINVLDRKTAELIAAGEVVERPSSAVKELLENCIDSGASAVTVEIKNGGTTFIRVTDNGCGIEKDDIKNAFLRHATSKIKTDTDLDSIATLGFRGEALAAVSSVARVEMLTAQKGTVSGTHYKIEGSEEVLFEESGCPEGTTIVIRDLFFNTPARMKFLKKDVSEANACAAVVDRIALSHPEVAFKFIRDGKVTLATSGDGNIKSAVYSILGREFSSTLMDIKTTELEGIGVSGLVCKPVNCKPTRNNQFIFLNGRLVRSGTVVAAVEQAFKNSAMIGKFPAFVIYVNVPFNTVDVNVHPAKTEVRFYDEKRIFDCIYNGVLSAITDDKSRLQATFSTAKAFMKPAEKGEQLKLNDIPVVTTEKPVFEVITERTFYVKEFGNIPDSEGVTLNSPKNDEPKQLDFLKDSIDKPLVTKISFNDSQTKVDSIIIEQKEIEQDEKGDPVEKYLFNYNEDMELYGAGRGYDGTVWQKVFAEGKEKYVMVAELNSVVPTFKVTADAPTMNPLPPHFDKQSNNVAYWLHVQPQ